MECLDIDWKNIDHTFVLDEFYESIQAPKWVDFTAPLQLAPDDDFEWFCGRIGCMHHKRVPCQAPDPIVHPQETPKSLMSLQMTNGVTGPVVHLPQKAVSAATGKRARGVLSTSVSSMPEAQAGASVKSKALLRPQMLPIAERKGLIAKKPVRQASENENPNQVCRAQGAIIPKAPMSRIPEGVTKKIKLAEQNDAGREPKVHVPARDHPNRALKEATTLSEQVNRRDIGKFTKPITSRRVTQAKSILGSIPSKEQFSDVSKLGSEIRQPEGSRLAVKSLAMSTKKTAVSRPLQSASLNRGKSALSRPPRILTKKDTKIGLLPDVRATDSDCTLANLPVGGMEDCKENNAVVEGAQLHEQLHSMEVRQEETYLEPRPQAHLEEVREEGLHATQDVQGDDTQPQTLPNDPMLQHNYEPHHQTHLEEVRQEDLPAIPEVYVMKVEDPQPQLLSNDPMLQHNEEALPCTSPQQDPSPPTLWKNEQVLLQTMELEQEQCHHVEQEVLIQQPFTGDGQPRALELNQWPEKDGMQKQAVEKEDMVQHALEDSLRNLHLNTPDDLGHCTSGHDMVQSVRCSSQTAATFQLGKPVSTQKVHNAMAATSEWSSSIPVCMQANRGKPAPNSNKNFGKNRNQKQQYLRHQPLSRGKKRKSSELNFKVNCSSKDHKHEIPKVPTTQLPVSSSLCQEPKHCPARLPTASSCQTLSDSCKEQHKKLRTVTATRPFRLRTEERGALKELGLGKKELEQATPQETVHHALRMPSFGHPFIPQRSTKKLTVPKEPKFHSLRTRKTCTQHVTVAAS